MSTTMATAVERYQPVMSEVEQTTLLWFGRRFPRLHPRRRHVGSAPVHRLGLAASTPAVRGSPRRHRMLRPRPRGPRQRPGDSGAPVVHDRRVLPLRRRGRRDRALPGGTHPPTKVDYESHVAHLDRNELGSILLTAGLSSPRDHALVSLLALNGLRLSEAIGANIEALGLELLELRQIRPRAGSRDRSTVV